MGDTVQLVFDHRSELPRGQVVSHAPCLEELRNPQPLTVVHENPARRPLHLGANLSIAKEFDKVNDCFIQHDPSCTHFSLRQVKGLTVPTGKIGAEERNHGEIQEHASQPDRLECRSRFNSRGLASVRIYRILCPQLRCACGAPLLSAAPSTLTR